MIATAVFLLPCSAADAARDGGASGVVLYVDDDAPPEVGDGLSWDTAFRYLQDALAVAHEPDSEVTEIRVGQGVYKPDQGSKQTPGDVDATFLIPSGLALRGGYAGIGAKDPDARDFEKFESILSGDLLGNDGPPGSWQNYGDNSYHVVTAIEPEPGIVVEGLVITAGQGEFIDEVVPGGGLRCIGGSIALLHCTIRYNLADSTGGVHLKDAVSEIRNCTFFRNRGSSANWPGGGMFIQGGSAIIEDSVFQMNSTQATNGAGLYASGDPIQIARCDFLHNGAGNNGAGAVVFGPSTIIDCRFIGNNSSCDGGGLWGGGLKFNCDFIGNVASVTGGGMYQTNGPTINCRFIDNFSGIMGGAAAHGRGTFINCEFRLNDAGGTPTQGGGGAVRVGLGGTTANEFINCLFNSNIAIGPGGAVYVANGLTAAFTNCTFANNGTQNGSGGAISGNATVHNSIIWSNAPAAFQGAVAAEYSCIQGTWPGEGNLGADPLFVDPAGPDKIHGTEDDDYRLSAGSPCIDSGNNLALPEDEFDLDDDGYTWDAMPIDLEGNNRLVNDPNAPNTGFPQGAQIIVDMGAFELADFEPLLGDADANGVVNVDDLLAVINGWGPCPNFPETCSADLNSDRIVNHVDLFEVIRNWS